MWVYVSMNGLLGPRTSNKPPFGPIFLTAQSIYTRADSTLPSATSKTYYRECGGFQTSCALDSNHLERQR